MYADNTVETIKIRKDNFNQYFPNNKWIDHDILDLSLDDSNRYLPSEQDAPQKSIDNTSVIVMTKSEVDTNIPTVQTTNPNTFVIIIANEKYQEVADVSYALNDGEVFMEYCHKVLGVPEKNIHIRKNATKNNIIAELS